MAISAVIQTRNEEKNLERCLSGLGFTQEMVVVDMESTDKTREIAKKFSAKVFTHPYTGYVEPARNFAIEKAQGDWILIIDADEELPAALSRKLVELSKRDKDVAFYRLPRKNIIFGAWIQHGLWWPDYQIRFFKKGAVEWKEEIHSIPYTRGIGQDLPSEEQWAIVHYNYQTIAQFIERLNRYSSQQAEEIMKRENYMFDWRQLLTRPVDEFLRRYFLAQGYKDGLHGLVLALLQGFSELVVSGKIWQCQGFPETNLLEIEKEFPKILNQKGRELGHWQRQAGKGAGVIGKLRSFFS